MTQKINKNRGNAIT